MTSILKLFVVLLIFFTNGVFAQTSSRKIGSVLSFENMYSTHSTHFTGVSAGINKRLSKMFSIGLGIEYSHCGYHDDNGWNLYDLNFVPVYVAQNFSLAYLNRFTPYIRLQEGISFVSYYKEFQDNPGPRKHIKENGFYGYGAVGCDYSLKNNLGLFAEAGIKSFQISRNELEVNPHGLNGKLGLNFIF